MLREEISPDTECVENTDNTIWLPYDNLSSADADIKISTRSSSINQADSALVNSLQPQAINQPQTLFASLARALFFRYSEQTEFLLCTHWQQSEQKWHSVELTSKIDGDNNLSQDIEKIANQLSEISENIPDTSHNFQLYISDGRQLKLDKSQWQAVVAKIDNLNDLSLFLLLDEESIHLQVNYNQTCFFSSTIDNFIEHFFNLIRYGQASTPLSELQVIAAKEMDWLRQVGYGGEHSFSEPNIVEQFQLIAQQYPDKVAVEFNQQNLTYNELNQKANQLAHYFLSCGIEQKSRIVVFLEPCLEIQIALLAIFKIGATYVPLDPGFPDKRIEDILEEVSADFAFTQQELVDKLQAYNIEQVTIHDLDSDFLALPVQNPNIKISPDSTATIFFTSGTTGRPKGVMASYANVHHYTAVARKKYTYNVNDIIPAVARFTFSISIFEVLSPILVGATSLILERSHVLDLDKMVKTLQQVSAAHIGPSLLKTLVAQVKSLSDHQFPNLRHISSGGDMVPPELIRDLQQLFPQAEIFVIYGCSEISCMGVTNFISPTQFVDKTFVGMPFENVKVALLNDDNQRVAKGCVGNVCFAGPGLVKGYLNLPELSQQKFFEFEGERYYNTGDRGRLNSQGQLELLGRRDFQIQLRGIRIELGEIEYILRKSPGVKDGVIAQKTLGSNDSALIAYLVPQTAINFDLSHVRAHLLQHLPDYMQPSHFMVLDKLPLNHNLKIDRSALPLPQLNLDGDYVAPETPLQQTIANIWQNLLSIDKISVQSNFFEIGGDSLTLAQSVTQLKHHHQFSTGLAQLFSYPKIADWSQLISNEKSQPDNNTLKITKAPKEQLVESAQTTLALASFTQAQFWFLYRVDKFSSANNIPAAFRLSGEFDYDIFCQAVQYLVARHQTLRTTFTYQNKQLYQVIHRALEIEIPLYDFASASSQEQSFAAHIEQGAYQAFDLESGPLFRCQVYQLPQAQYAVLICFHHILVDQTSITQFGAELEIIYQQMCQQQSVNLPNIELQYHDYAIWQHQIQQQLAPQLDFWRQELDRVSSYLEFPLDRSRTHSNQGCDFNLYFDQDFTDNIESFAKQQGLSVYLVLLTAYAITLNRYTQKEEVIVGTPFANRGEHVELQNILGCFIHTLPIVIRFDEKHSFASLLEQVKSTVYLVSENQSVPTEMVLDQTNIERGSNYNPLYQVGFTYQEMPLSLNLPGCNIQPIELTSQHAQLDFISRLWRDGDGIQGVVTYNSSIFDQQTIENFVDHFSTLLASAIHQPENHVNELALHSKRQLTLLEQWNQTTHDFDQNALLLDQFEAQVKLNPDKVAVEFMQQRLSYQELSDKADKLADFILANGIQPRDLVGIYTQRSLEMIIAIYATLKAGGVYVPIDPEHPGDRINYIVEEANIKIVLTHSTFAQATLNNTLMVDIEQQWSEIQQAPVAVKDRVNSTDLAYVIYTSGSTGRPKGVMNNHRGVLNSFEWMQDTFKLTPDDSILLKTPFTFDVSVWEIFWPLMKGAKLVVAEVDGHKDTRYLKQVIKQKEISFLNFVPSMMQHLLEKETLKDCPNLRSVLSGGELLPYELTKLFFEKTNAILYNGYGPTEAAICVSLWHCQENDGMPDIPIGNAVYNTQFYVLSPDLTRQPVGAIGELYIGGIQVANGYASQPQLTADRFVDNPFDDGQSKIYKTGDLVRQLNNGSLIYIGRTDFQTKIRGLRIELGEIETRLLALNAINQCVVIVREDIPGDKRLVAYYDILNDEKVTAEQMRQHLKLELPNYMVPQFFIELERLPLTSSGKIDRKNLPSPAELNIRDNKTIVEPTTREEKIIAKIWRDIIGIEQVSTNANFFDLGGHSLLSIQVIEQIEQELGAEITAHDILMDSLAQIAAKCTDTTGAINKDKSPKPKKSLFSWLKQ